MMLLNCGGAASHFLFLALYPITRAIPLLQRLPSHRQQFPRVTLAIGKGIHLAAIIPQLNQPNQPAGEAFGIASVIPSAAPAPRRQPSQIQRFLVNFQL
jgi:hypothetical protein